MYCRLDSYKRGYTRATKLQESAHIAHKIHDNERYFREYCTTKGLDLVLSSDRIDEITRNYYVIIRWDLDKN